MEIKEDNEELLRNEFSDWINAVASELPDSKPEANLLRRFYVYALCRKTEDDRLIPFYIGKGTGDRVWCHADEAEQEKEIQEEARRYKLPDEEKELLVETLNAKNKVINELGRNNIEKLIIKSGLTEFESFMCESALINLLRLEKLSYNDANQLTNKANGHSNQFEKKEKIETAALPVEEYYNLYCKKPIVVNELTDEQRDDLSGIKILFQCINDSYKDCIRTDIFPTQAEQNDAIREAVRGFWRQGDIERMDYVFAMYQGRIKGIYKVKGIYKILDINRPDYPWSDKLPVRKIENESVKIIYSDLEKHGMISADNLSLASNTEGSVYSALDSRTQGAIRYLFSKGFKDSYREFIKKRRLPDDDNSLNSYYDNKLINWTQRKYFVLEDLSGEQATKLNKYLNCSVKIKRGDDCDSIFSGNKRIDANGKIKRNYSFSFRYSVNLEIK